MMFPDKTMQQWGDVYNATREAIRLVYNKATGGEFGQDRMDRMYGTEPDMELLKKVFKDYVYSFQKLNKLPELYLDIALTVQFDLVNKVRVEGSSS